MKKVVTLLGCAAVVLAFACSGEEPCNFVTRCNGQQVEGCHGSTVIVEDTCAPPNECTVFDGGFAACAVPNKNCADDLGTCFQNARLFCSSDSRASGLSFVTASPCTGGTSCYADAGQTRCE